MERIGILIVAGGSGHRMGSSRPKQFLLLGGEPLLARTINTFAATLPGAEISVVLPAAHIEFWRNLAARFTVAKHAIIEGGAERFYSVQNGLAALSQDVELIAIHDGVRPLVTPELIHRCVDAAATHGAVVPVVEPTDSFRKVGIAPHLEPGAQAEVICSSEIINRRELRAVQTPQIFRADLLRSAYEAPFCTEFTDDATVVEAAGTPIALCAGEYRNLKITTPEDLLFAEAILDAESTSGTENDE